MSRLFSILLLTFSLFIPAGRAQTSTVGTHPQSVNTIWSGDGQPDDSMGNDGDFYINTQASVGGGLIMFGPKVGGSWPAFGLLVAAGNTSTFLRSANNLGDLLNVAAARLNLGLGSLATKNGSGSGGLVLTATGAFTNGDCIQTDSGGNAVDAGHGCVTTQVGPAPTTRWVPLMSASTNIVGAALAMTNPTNPTTVATFSGSTVNGHCVSLNANGDEIDAGLACGVSGGTAQHGAIYNSLGVLSDSGYPAFLVNSPAPLGSGFPLIATNTNPYTVSQWYSPSGNTTSGSGGLVLTATGAFTNGDCIQTDSGGNAVDAGHGCVTTQVGPPPTTRWMPIMSANTNIVGASLAMTNPTSPTKVTTFSGSTVTGDCISLNVNGDAVDAGLPCGVSAGTAQHGAIYNSLGVLSDSGYPAFLVNSPAPSNLGFPLIATNTNPYTISQWYSPSGNTTKLVTTAGSFTTGGFPAWDSVGNLTSGVNSFPTGNGAKVATSTGTLTPSDCANWDASGNVVDAGAPCAVATHFVANNTNIFSPQFIPSPISSPQVNSVFYVDGFPTAGGNYRGAWSSATTYSQYDTVTYDGVAAPTTAGTATTPATITSTSFNIQFADSRQVRVNGIGVVPNGTYYEKATGQAANTIALYSDSGLTTPVASTGAYTTGNLFAQVDWITPSGNINIPPNGSFAVPTTQWWIQFDSNGAGRAATQADSAFYWAYKQVQEHSTSFAIQASINLEFGSLVGGYTKNGDWTFPKNIYGYTIAMHGKGRGVSWINQGVSTLNYVLDIGWSANKIVSTEVTALTINANSLSGGCLNVHGVRRSRFQDIQCWNPDQQPGGSIANAMYFGQSGDSYELDVMDILVRGASANFNTVGTATGTVTLSAGAVSSFTIVAGGSNLDLPIATGHGLVTYFSGTNGGTSYQPCTVMPGQPTYTLTAGVLTAMAVSTGGSGCSGTVTFITQTAGSIPNAYYFGMSDSTATDIVTGSAFTNTCQIDQGSNTYIHEHPYCQAPFQIEMNGGVHTGLEIDTPVQYGVHLKSGDIISSMFSEWAVPYVGTGEIFFDTNASYATIAASSCYVFAPGGVGYNKFISTIGPFTPATGLPGTNIGIVISGSQPICDGGASVWGNYPVALDVTSASNFVLVDDFVTASLTGNLAWTLGNIGAAPAQGTVTGTFPHVGIKSLATTAVSTQGYTMTLGGVNGGGQLFPSLTANTNWSSEWINTLSAWTSVQYRWGYVNGAVTAGIPTSGYYFRYDTTLGTPDTKVMACVNLTSTEACTATAITPAAGVFHDYFISSSVAGTIKFQVDAGTVITACASGCTISTTMYTGVSFPQAIHVTATTAISTAQYDFFKFVWTGLGR